ncbi:MAG: hypothetical protein II896_01980 [Clostridia bacterium]|nr:hypothetical protein [Clostridia bacterium]
MLRLIYGSKGTGKTAQIIDEANDFAKQCEGALVFLTDTDKYTYKINYDIRLINVYEYDVHQDVELSGFIRGVIASNADIMRIYIDGVNRMTRKTYPELEGFFDELDKISTAHNVELVLTISAEELPDYMKAYTLQHA